MPASNKPQPKSVICGEYNCDGYEIWRDGQVVYTAGNHAQDSCQSARDRRDRLPLKTLRKFCIQTAREIATEEGGIFGGVERVRDE